MDPKKVNQQQMGLYGRNKRLRMEKFSFKDVLVLVAGLFITTGIAYGILTVTGFIPTDIAKLFYEGAFVGQRNIKYLKYCYTIYFDICGYVISFRVGMFNIGINSSMYVGALYAAWALDIDLLL